MRRPTSSPEISDQTTEVPGRRGLALGMLDGLLGFHVRMAQAAIYRDFAASLAPLDITQKQFATLELIACNPGVSQIDLAATLGTDRATMMALVDRLDARGWVERAVSAVDRRRQELRLTATGRADLDRARAMAVAHEERLLDGISSAERTTLAAVLGRIHAR
ncbi:MAG: MarR family transcriptional regulator [Devosia sp.]|nr:MarR family transcriptional regulator [Devosia sp.]